MLQHRAGMKHTTKNKTIVISKSFCLHVVHVYKQSMHIIRVNPFSCHTWLVKEARVWTKCDLVESCDKMTKICHIFNTWSWPLYLSIICWWKDNKVHSGLCNSIFCLSQVAIVAVSDTYQDDISNGYSILDEKLTIGYFILDEIPTTCFQLCELV